MITHMKKGTASNVGSGAVGVPLAVIIAWLLQINGVQMPPEVTVALGALLTWAAGLAASAMAQD
jgi:hypothetical protein